MLSTELKQLKSLESQYEALLKTSYTEEVILEKTVALFNEVLTHRLEKDEETVKIFSKYISKIIAQSQKDYPEKLNQVLQETIALTISREVENNKESMIDSLYPILGGMISKYVSLMMKEMTQTINQRVEEGLSFKAYRRKAKAKMTGVSESDLLISESDYAMISSLLIVQKESGLLIAEAQLETSQLDDAHMIASMASAIKDFINDWIQKNESHDEVQILTYGEATLYIESAGSVYLIAFLDKEPAYELRRDMNTFFASIIKEYAFYFRAFNGDDESKEVLEVSEALQLYVDKQVMTSTKKQNYLKNILYFILLISFSSMAYQGYFMFKAYGLEKNIKEVTGEEIKLSYADNRLLLEGYVSEYKYIKEIQSFLSQKESISIDNHLMLETTVLLETSMKESAKQIEILTKYRKVLEENILTLHEKTQKEKEVFYKEKSLVKEKISIALKKIFLENTVYENQRLNFKHLQLFHMGKETYNPKVIKTVKKDFESYMRVLFPYKEHIKSIVIEGHSDSTGNKIKNQKLSRKRALSIRNILAKLPMIKAYHLEPLLKIEVAGSEDIIMVNGVEDKYASRRIEIYFVLKESMFLNTLERIIND
ncbi:Putative periplasmic protein [hydrothermal vent metagenome]|uniref:Putative periplasmic protein n=1 Tax=hydrothermal vent metagenome TaxID=652676 RepID=A0A1W1BJ09_9ZZZZ